MENRFLDLDHQGLGNIKGWTTSITGIRHTYELQPSRPGESPVTANKKSGMAAATLNR
jgi:hypothetical protein